MPTGRIMLSVFTLAGKPSHARNPDAEETKKLKYLKQPRTPRLTQTLVAIQKRRHAGLSVRPSIWPTM
jgi:hypothetical protein